MDPTATMRTHPLRVLRIAVAGLLAIFASSHPVLREHPSDPQSSSADFFRRNFRNLTIDTSVLYARNVTATGFKQVLRSSTPGGSLAGTALAEYSSHVPWLGESAGRRPLALLHHERRWLEVGRGRDPGRG
jgi:hypothetical protein